MSTKQTDILENLYEGVYFVDKDRTITSWNNGAFDITGFESKEVIHKKCYENILNHVDINGVALCFDGCPLHATIQDGIAREANVFLQHKNGHRVPVKIKALPIYNNEGGIVGAVEIFNEIKEERDIKNDLIKLQTEASQDALTQVPNRKYLNAIIESKIREFKAVNVSFGINFIDIDNFKHINDTYGHGVGDDVLKLLVQTIQANLRKNDVIGRLGGEEFIIVFSDINDSGLEKVSEKIRTLVEASALRLTDQDLKITISIGATLVNSSDTVLSIIERSDNLMYQSKKNGKNRVTFG
jgi:diguanylate cyclase (GGDEF)-like protein/PAS domain S-box-containing protein